MYSLLPPPLPSPPLPPSLSLPPNSAPFGRRQKRTLGLSPFPFSSVSPPPCFTLASPSLLLSFPPSLPSPMVELLEESSLSTALQSSLTAPPTILNCPQCPKTFETPNKLQQHQQMFHTDKVWYTVYSTHTVSPPLSS